MLKKKIIMSLIVGGVAIGIAGADNHTASKEPEKLIETAALPKTEKKETKAEKRNRIKQHERQEQHHETMKEMHKEATAYHQ